MPTPSLKFIKTFQVAAKCQCFKAAADELCITASAVSHQIKLLESQLGLMLFERGPRSLKLSEAGAYYLQNIDPLFSRIESVTEQLCERYSRSVVRLQVTPFFASEFLLPHLSLFSQTHPDIDLQIGTHTTTRSEHPTEVDVSVLVGSGPWPDLTTVSLFPQSFVPAASPGLVAKLALREPADLVAQTLIAHNTRLSLWDQWAALYGVEELKPKQLIRFDSMSAAVHAAETGVGIAMVSTPLAAGRFAAGTLVKALKAELLTGESYYLAARQEDHERPAVRTLIKWLVQQFGRSSEAKNYLA